MSAYTELYGETYGASGGVFRLRKPGGGSTLRGGDTLRGADAPNVVKVVTETVTVTESRSTATGISRVVSETLTWIESRSLARFQVLTEVLRWVEAAVHQVAYLFITPLEVPSIMSASIREASPTTADPESQFLRLDGTGGARVRSLLFVDRKVPVGVGGTVIKAQLLLRKSEAWPAGTHTLTAEAVAAAWEGSTVDWATQPGVRAPAVNVVVPAAGAAGDIITVDITTLLSAAVAADDASGSRWFGLRLSIDTGGEKKFWSSHATTPDLRPELKLEYSLPPGVIEDLQPSGGRSVSEVKPEFVGLFRDPDAEDTLGFLQVEISTTETFDTLTYDSGKVATNEARFDMNAPPAGAAAPPTLLVDTDYWVRMTPWDNHGVQGPVSVPVKFRITTKGTLTLTAPSGATVATPTPTITHTFTGATQSQVEVEVEKKIGGIWLPHWHVPRYVTSSTSHTIPNAYRLEEGITYRVTVRVWDTVNREDMAGDRAFVEVQREITLVGLPV